MIQFLGIGYDGDHVRQLYQVSTTIAEKHGSGFQFVVIRIITAVISGGVVYGFGDRIFFAEINSGIGVGDDEFCRRRFDVGKFRSAEIVIVGDG